MKKVVVDTNVYIDWFNKGAHEEVMLGPGVARYLSAVVVMELRAGTTTRRARNAVDKLVRAYAAGGRLVTPPYVVFDRAGSVLRELNLGGRDVRSASLLNDVLIAGTARFLGATVITSNLSDFEAIQAVERFDLQAPGH